MLKIKLNKSPLGYFSFRSLLGKRSSIISANVHGIADGRAIENLLPELKMNYLLMLKIKNNAKL